MNPRFRSFTNAAELAVELARHVSNLLRRGVEASGKASLVVSGGSTPVPFFEALAETEPGWEKVWVTLADERWVDVTRPESNENLLRRHLLRKRAAEARFVGLKTAAVGAAEAETECGARLAAVPLPFDVVVLGMGSDGHTASLFPGAAELSRALNTAPGTLCAAVMPPGAPFERMTLTLGALLQCRRIIVHITGDEKRRVYEKAVAGGPAEEMPIRAVFGQTAVPVTVWWAP